MHEPCEQVMADLGAFIDRELEPEERKRVEAHLRSCPACRRLEQKLRRDWKLLGMLPAPAAVDSGRFLARVMSRFHAQRRLRVMRWTAGIAAAAAALLVTLHWPGGLDPSRPGPGLQSPDSGNRADDPSIIQNLAILADLQSETADVDPEILPRILKELDPLAQIPDASGEELDDILNLLLEEELEG